MEKLKPYAVLLAALVVLVLVWNYFRPANQKTGEYNAVETSSEVSNLKPVPVSGTVNVIPDPAKKKLKLPDNVQRDPNAVVIGATSLPASDAPSTFITFWDPTTGDVSGQVRKDPLPWLAAESRWYARLGAGAKTRSGTVGQLAVGGNVVQMKALHVGASAEIFTDGDAYAGVHLEVKF